MARPNKTGLDYFPFDVDFFEDEKIVAISGEFGIKGEITVIKLLCAIYRNGYFILWNDLLKYKLLKNLYGISSELIDSIVNRLVLWEFFDKALFDSVKVLTSKGIQKRYFEASKRRKNIGELPYLLIDGVCGCENKKFLSTIDANNSSDNNVFGCGVNVCNNPSTADVKASAFSGEIPEDSINVYNNGVNVCNNPISNDINANKKPTKESKGKKSKVNSSIPPTPPKGDVPPPKAKKGKEKKDAPLNAKAREVFESHYKATFDADYYWTAKDAGNMSKLLDKLKFQRGQRNLLVDDEAVLSALSAFLKTIDDGWIFEHFSVANINSMFNELRTKAISKRNDNRNECNTTIGGFSNPVGAFYAKQTAGDKAASREAVGKLARAILEKYKPED